MLACDSAICLRTRAAWLRNALREPSLSRLHPFAIAMAWLCLYLWDLLSSAHWPGSSWALGRNCWAGRIPGCSYMSLCHSGLAREEEARPVRGVVSLPNRPLGLKGLFNSTSGPWVFLCFSLVGEKVLWATSPALSADCQGSVCGCVS